MNIIRLLNVSPKALASPIPKLVQRLYDNYELDTRKEEDVTKEENTEEDALIDAILATDVMASTMDFLSNKGFFNKDFEEFKKTLKNIWFSVFSREKGKYGSSGFEHIFLAEKKRGRSIGLHNWIFFHTEELAKKLNYFGYLRNLDINGKAAVAMLRFTYNGKIKSSSMFIGTSPELEMALYTLCFFARPNRYCRLSLNEKKLGIQTYVWNDRNKELIAAAFPMI
ncbi:poly(U)-specific endoribonuclease homolog [Cephus cinctus]|uniref:Poly(U)-specific endoribonuclease homolog n=1 Tax=Cephus cinctus TaxID=211228 RepID=A0AAJ7RBA5_CEPCN|nr:poly(U)-specific endoribonuclease homolog [Cephus cinctus]